METYHDRAMQCLYAFALDPVAEAWGDRGSFAYRKGRSHFDLNEYIKQALSGCDAPEWVFIGDVRQCYESISHQWVMEHIPMSGRVMHQFLRAGFVFGGQLFPMQKGVGIGCTLSPIVANMTLDGLQRHIYERLYPGGADIDHVTGVYRGVWNRQEGRCHYCGCRILRDDDKTLIEVDPKKSRFAARMAYVHTRCLSGSLDYIDTPGVPASVNDLRALLLLLEAGRKPVGQKHHKLYEYFRANDADPIALTFGEIEGIMGEPLGKSARQKQFWQRTGFLCISQCWLMNGYRIARLRLREGTVEDKARPALAAINRKNGCPVKPVPTHPLV